MHDLDKDWLAQAARALRDEHSGRRLSSGMTRARVLAEVARARRRRMRRWLLTGSLFTIMVGGTAWAQASGRLERVWQVLSVAASVLTSSRSASPSKPSSTALTQADSPRPETVQAAEPVPPEAPPAPMVEPPAPSVPAIRTSPRLEGRTSPRSGANRATPVAPSEPATPDESPLELEVRDFRSAYDIDLKERDPERAIAAYGEYLRHYPDGRFVPEARYNLALCHLKLGATERAVPLLREIAAGRYGSQRQEQARSLLAALEHRPSPP